MTVLSRLITILRRNNPFVLLCKFWSRVPILEPSDGRMGRMKIVRILVCWIRIHMLAQVTHPSRGYSCEIPFSPATTQKIGRGLAMSNS